MTKLTTRILSHVALIDLEGRYGVQGSDTQSLYLYFSDFLEKYSTTDVRYINLAMILKDLAKKTNEILALDYSPDLNKLTDLSKIHAHAILALSEGETYYLPGGWNNREGHSHAIIFAWNKKHDGYDFFIYNGGAGIEYHDEIASIYSPQFYPVKIYNITNLNHSACQDLIQLLIMPQVVHVAWRAGTRFFDSQKFYEQIQVGMTFLKATPIEASTRYSQALSTLGITSGTCAQASIQQMVKIFLNDLNAFQKLMVNYKYHTMVEYVSIAPPPYSKTLHQLFEKGIGNLLKIVDASCAFSHEEKETWFDNILKFKDDLTYEPTFLSTSQPITIPGKPSVSNSTSNSNYLGDIQSLSATSQQEPAEIKTAIDKLSPLDELTRLASDKFSPENGELLEEAIDKILLQLPLPESSEAFRGLALPFYAHFTLDKWENFTEKLNTINKMYEEVLRYEKEYFNHYVTRWSLFSLIDYSICQQIRLGSKYQYPLQRAIYPIMQAHQFFFQRAFFLTTRDPAADKRLLQIQQLYPPNVKHLYCDSGLSIKQKITLALDLYPAYQVEKVNDYMCNLILFASQSNENIEFHQILFYLQGFSELDYYRTLFKQHPKQKELLEAWYETYHTKAGDFNRIMHDELEKLDLIAVFCFFDLLINYPHSPNPFAGQALIPQIDNSTIESLNEAEQGNKRQQISKEIVNHPLFSFFQKQYLIMVQKTFKTYGPEQCLAAMQQLLAELKWLEKHHFKELLISIAKHEQVSKFVYFCIKRGQPGNIDRVDSALNMSKHNMLCLNSTLASLYEPSQVLSHGTWPLNPTLEQILGPDIPRGKSLFKSYNKPISSNQIACQDKPYKIKQWKYLSLSNELRALFALSYFSSETGIAQLTDPNAQAVLEANLMQPHSLIKWVQKDPLIFREKIQKITARGMAIFQDSASNALSPEGVFLIRLQYLMYRYLYLYDNSPTSLEDLISFYQNLEISLAKDVNQSIMSQLSFYYFSTGMFLSEIHSNHPIDMQKLFRAYVEIKYNKDHLLSQLDPLTRTEFQTIQRKFQAQLKHTNHGLYPSDLKMRTMQVLSVENYH